MTAAQAFQRIAHNCLRQYVSTKIGCWSKAITARSIRPALGCAAFAPRSACFADAEGNRLDHFSDGIAMADRHLGQVRNLDVVMADCVSKRLGVG